MSTQRSRLECLPRQRITKYEVQYLEPFESLTYGNTGCTWTLVLPPVICFDALGGGQKRGILVLRTSPLTKALTLLASPIRRDGSGVSPVFMKRGLTSGRVDTTPGQESFSALRNLPIESSAALEPLHASI